MGSPDTANALSRTTVTIMEGVDMNELLEELRRELVPDIPDDAVTIKQLMNMDEKISKSTAQRHLAEKVEKHGWTKVKLKGVNYYWPPQ